MRLPLSKVLHWTRAAKARLPCPSRVSGACADAMSGSRREPGGEGGGGDGHPHRRSRARGTIDRIVSSIRGPRSGAAEAREHSPTPEDLGLKTLRQVYADYRQIDKPSEKERHLYKILPLFCKNCAKLSAHELVTKFPEVYDFAESVSLLFVRHVTQLAQSANARVGAALLRYFEVNEREEGRETGLLILRALHILSNGPENLIGVMMASDITAILVRCIHLFLDLPPPVVAVVRDAGWQGMERRAAMV